MLHVTLFDEQGMEVQVLPCSRYEIEGIYEFWDSVEDLHFSLKIERE